MAWSRCCVPRLRVSFVTSAAWTAKKNDGRKERGESWQTNTQWLSVVKVKSCRFWHAWTAGEF